MSRNGLYLISFKRLVCLSSNFSIKGIGVATTGANVCSFGAPVLGRTAVIGIPVVVIIVGSTLGKNLAGATSKALVDATTVLL